MAINNPRIIIVENTPELAGLVRSALDLLGRKPRIIEAYTGEDAMDELRLRTPDVLITALRITGTMDGIALAQTAKRAVAALPVIVMGSEDDQELDPEMLADAPFQFLRRPMLPEIFIKMLRIALDGPEAVPKEETASDSLGPVPQLDVDKLRPICAKLMRDVTAMSFVLADRNGKVLTYDGMAGYIDRDALAAALGPTFGVTAKMMPVVGDQPRVLKFYDGDKFDVYSLAIGLHYFLCLIFDGVNGNRALGNVARFGRTAVDEMLAIVGEPAFKLQPEAAGATQVRAPEDHTHKSRGRRRSTQEMSAVKPTTTQVPSQPAKRDTQALPVPKPLMLDPIANFDPGILDALDSMDMSKADELFDPDRLAATLNSLGNGNRISSSDAAAQGIINWEE